MLVGHDARHGSEQFAIGIVAVLEAAGLVVTLRVGREKRHHLNPVPITAIAARWVGKFAQPYAEALVALKADLERPSGTEPPPVKESS